MEIEELRNFCLSLPGAEEGFPFDKTTLVFSVRSKMFCATNVETFEFINVKCNPEKAILLREKYKEVIPGYYMNKNHWNSIMTKGRIGDNLMKEWIRDSYTLIVSNLPKKTQREFGLE